VQSYVGQTQRRRKEKASPASSFDATKHTPHPPVASPLSGAGPRLVYLFLQARGVACAREVVWMTALLKSTTSSSLLLWATHETRRTKQASEGDYYG